MRQVFRVIFGFLCALTPLFGVAGMAPLLYAALPNYYGIGLAVLLLALGLLFSIYIFKMVLRVGAVDFVSARFATPGLDKLQLSPDSKTKEISAAQLVEDVLGQTVPCKTGSIQIFGDWYGQSYSKKFTVLGASYLDKGAILELTFDQGLSIQLNNVGRIHVAPSFIKIFTSDHVLLTHNSNQIQYVAKGRKIIKSDNTNKPSRKGQGYIGKPAFMFFGEF